MKMLIDHCTMLWVLHRVQVDVLFIHRMMERTFVVSGQIIS